MMSSDKGSPLEDIDFLARSDQRILTLVALARRPQSREDLRKITGVSQSTIRRTLRQFEKRDWIKRDGRQYEATQLGAFVASGMWDLIERLETEHRLREVWQWLPSEESGLDVEMFDDAVVTVPEADDPYRPVNRFISMVGKTERLRFVGFDVALLEPCKDELCEQIIDGMHTEFIHPPNVIHYIRSTSPERFSEALESGNLTVRVHDDLPTYGVGILDDRIVISGYDATSGSVQVLVDTGTSEAHRWATSIYESYRREIPTLPLGPTVDDQL